MRTTDRHFISEAIRRSTVWRMEDNWAKGHVVVTDYDERLSVQYGNSGQVVSATYTHWDHDTGEIVCREVYTTQKRRKVLDHLRQKDTDQ